MINVSDNVSALQEKIVHRIRKCIIVALENADKLEVVIKIIFHKSKSNLI